MDATFDLVSLDKPESPAFQCTNDLSSLDSLFLRGVNYDYISLLRKLGPLPNLEALVIDLAVPTVDQCPIGQPRRLPSWYSQGIDTVVRWLVGKRSSLTNLTLHGFYAYAMQVGSEHDLLGRLSDPIYFPCLSHVNLSGFSPAKDSRFWSLIQRTDGENEKLPLKRITFYIKHCRQDLTDHDLSQYVLQGGAAFRPFTKRNTSGLKRSVQCDILFDSNVYTGQNLIPNFSGYTCIVNEPKFRGVTMQFEHRQGGLSWSEYDLAPLQPKLDSPGWLPVSLL